MKYLVALGTNNRTVLMINVLNAIIIAGREAFRDKFLIVFGLMLMKNSQFNFVSLFSGCGGFDLGFIQAGFKCHNAFDIDPVAVATHCLNLSSGAVLRDLNSDVNHISSQINPDVLLAGPPCQGFSTAGKRRINDPRNSLLLKAGEIAIKMKPKVFITENVRGVVSGEHKKYWTNLIKLLRSNGYKTHDFLIGASSLGLAQIRKRMLLVAWRTPKELSFSEPNCNKRILSDAIGCINGEPNHKKKYLDPNSKLFLISKNIEPGQKLSNVRGGARSIHTWDIPDVFGFVSETEREILESILKLRRRIRLRTTGDADPVLSSDIENFLGHNPINDILSLIEKGYIRKVGNRFDVTNAFNGKSRRLRWDQISPTVDTRFTDPRYFLHPDEQRGFTIREAARIQGFPDSFVFVGSDKDQCRLIGNAVPPPLGKWLGKSIKHLLV